MQSEEKHSSLWWGGGPRRLRHPLLSAFWPLGLEAAQDELGCRLFCLEERNHLTFKESKIWAGEKVTKKCVCHHAKWRHLNIFLVTMVALVRESTAALGQCSSQSSVAGESNPWNPLSPLPAALGRLHSPWPSLPGC